MQGDRVGGAEGPCAKERRRCRVEPPVEEERCGARALAATNPKGWAGNGPRAASLVVDSWIKLGLLLALCARAIPGPARSPRILRPSLAHLPLNPGGRSG